MTRTRTDQSRRGGEIDHEALRARYEHERRRRLRPEGNEQYIAPSGRFAHFLDDPYSEVIPRDPIEEEVTAVVIGAGFGGLTTAARLKEAGISDVRVIEGGGDVGGAWYWNRYPGAMCDTAAMIYLPLLEETGYLPTAKYVMAPEILAHARRIATTFDLYDRALFSTQVRALTWVDESSEWRVETDRGDVLHARYVALGTGPLHRPKLPGIPGIETFQGHCFHTSRWDYAYTGGDDTGRPMDRLGDARVGIIGTGATAVQCISHLARAAKELFVFQRTASSVDVRGNRPLDPELRDTLQPGWQREWLMNFATLQTGGFVEVDLVQDGWTDIAVRIRDRMVAVLEAGGDEDDLKRAYEECDDEKMTEIRARIEDIVSDPWTADALKPWYRQLCKRPCFHDDYLPVFNLPGVHLVPTDGHGVDGIDASGVVVAGQHIALDCVIFASGFEVGTEYARRSGFETVGRAGRRLSDHWADGMRSLHGVHVAGFPNLFIIGASQGANLISNITHNLSDAAVTIATVVREAESNGRAIVEVTADAEDEWVELLAANASSFFGNPECTPGYYNNEGKPVGRRERLNSSGYPAGAPAFFTYIDQWRRSGSFEGLEFRRVDVDAPAP